MVARWMIVAAVVAGCATPPGRWDPSLKISAFEHPLSPKEGRTYRLRWLRSFHPQVSVRIRRLGSHAVVSAVMMDLDGPILRHRGFATTAASFDRVDALLAQARFWQGGPQANAEEALDGAYWIIEGTADGRYAEEMLYSSDVIPGAVGSDAPLPPENVAFREAALLLLEIAGMKSWCSTQIY